MKNAKFLLSLLVAGLVLGGASVGLAQQSEIMQMVNKPAPDFSLKLFSGGKAALKDFQGQVVVVNFWNSR